MTDETELQDEGQEPGDDEDFLVVLRLTDDQCGVLDDALRARATALSNCDVLTTTENEVLGRRLHEVASKILSAREKTWRRRSGGAS